MYSCYWIKSDTMNGQCWCSEDFKTNPKFVRSRNGWLLILTAKTGQLKLEKYEYFVP